MPRRMDGKVAIVTGAGSGMGKAIAFAFMEEGAKVLGADMNELRLNDLKKEAEEKGYAEQIAVQKCNVCSDEDCESALKACIEAFGTCNVLSHNAGISDDFSMVTEIKNEDWDKVLAVNLTGSMKITRSVIPYFLENEIEASIVMITSNAAFESATGGPAYCASKAGANALMKSIAFEYYRDGIRCNSICPGPILTNITDTYPVRSKEGEKVHCASGYNADSWKWTGGMIGMPEQIAPLAVYLASDESVFMNGNSCVIDSGVCLSR